MSDKNQKTSGFGIGEAGGASASTPHDEAEAERLQPTVTKATKMARCARCGDMVPAAWLMGSNQHGMVCADCYDQLDEDE
jgi:hypothetical protein